MGWEKERVGIDRRGSGVGGGESGDRQEWGTRGGVGWEGKRLGIDRRGSGVGGGESGDRRSGVEGGESGDRQEEWGGRGRERG